jgi:uncharacterized membrane protein
MVGYVHLGDVFIFFACFLLKPKYSILVGGAGSALADLILGWAFYAPVTFVVKALVALCCSLIIYKNPTIVRQIISLVIGAIIIGLGYFIYEYILYGLGVAAANVPFNLAQGAVCGVIAIFLTRAFEKIKPLKEFKDKLS